jgi:hypothetical protein
MDEPITTHSTRLDWSFRKRYSLALIAYGVPIFALSAIFSWKQGWISSGEFLTGIGDALVGSLFLAGMEHLVARRIAARRARRAE